MRVRDPQAHEDRPPVVDQGNDPPQWRKSLKRINWWSIFMRLGIPDKHAEAITSRPLALQGIARQTRHGNQTTVEITSMHAEASTITEILTNVSAFLKRIKTTTERLTKRETWSLILSFAFRHFLGGKVLGSPGRLADPTCWLPFLG